MLRKQLQESNYTRSVKQYLLTAHVLLQLEDHQKVQFLHTQELQVTVVVAHLCMAQLLQVVLTEDELLCMAHKRLCTEILVPAPLITDRR